MATSRKLRHRSAAHQNGHASPPSSSQQRLQKAFTERDETRILKTYLRLLSESSMATTAEISTESLNAIQASLGGCFCHSQIVEKLRRLRLAYHRHERSETPVETPHEKKLFSIARNIWGKQKRLREESEEETEAEAEAGEEFATVSEPGEVFTVVIEELHRALPGNKTWEEGLGCLDREKVREFNKQWILLTTEEAELVARKAELMSELIRVVVDAIGTRNSV